MYCKEEEMRNGQSGTRTRLGDLVLNRPTLTQIAQEANVSVSYVSAVAAGRKPASSKVRLAAAKVLRLPPHEIFPE